MKTIILEIFEFQELSQEAQQRAFRDWGEDRCAEEEYNDSWGRENNKSLEKFADLFGVRVKEWDAAVNWGQPYFRWEHKFGSEWDSIAWHTDDDLRGHRLAKWIYNNFKWALYKGKLFYKGAKRRYSKVTFEENMLTGYCMDCVLTDEIFAFLKSPNDSDTFDDILDRCFDKFLEAIKAEVEYQESFQAFVEYNACRNIEYLEDGSVFKED